MAKKAELEMVAKLADAALNLLVAKDLVPAWKVDLCLASGRMDFLADCLNKWAAGDDGDPEEVLG